MATDYEIKLTRVQFYNLGVKIDTLKSVDYTFALYFPAKVIIPPHQEHIISVTHAGLIKKLYVSVGDKVEKNQALAQINSPELLSLQRQYLKANGQQELALNNEQEDKKLLQEGVISKRRWQKSDNQYNSSLAETSAIKQLLKMAGMSTNDIKKLASSRQLSNQLTLYSPMKGIVLDSMAITGEKLDILDPLYRIANIEQLWLQINIPQQQISYIEIGTPVLIENTDITAKINLLAQRVSADNQTILVNAVIDDIQPTLRVGQQVNLKIIEANDKAVYSVPNTAIVETKGQHYIFIRHDTGFTVSLINIIEKKEKNSIITSHNHLDKETEIAIRGAMALKANWLR